MRRRGLGVVPAPALPGGAAGEEEGLGPGAQDREQVEVADQVAADLEEVGHPARSAMRSMTAAVVVSAKAHADLGHRDKRKSLFRIP